MKNIIVSMIAMTIGVLTSGCHSDAWNMCYQDHTDLLHIPADDSNF